MTKAGARVEIALFCSMTCQPCSEDPANRAGRNSNPPVSLYIKMHCYLNEHIDVALPTLFAQNSLKF